MNDTTKWTAHNAGMIFDGAHGQKVMDLQVIDLACGSGWTLTADDRVYADAAWTNAETVVSPLTGDTIGRPEITDALGEIAQEACEWLNSNAVDADVYFEWSDGDFVLTFDGDTTDGRA